MKTLFTVALVIFISACKNKSTIRVPENHAALNSKNGEVYFNEIPLSGLIFRLDNNQDTLYKAFYIKGKKYGSERFWYSTHQLKQERLYKNDVLHGIQREWYINGNPKTICTYNKNVLDGPVMKWNEHGSLVLEQYYKDGIGAIVAGMGTGN